MKVQPTSPAGRTFVFNDAVMRMRRLREITCLIYIDAFIFARGLAWPGVAPRGVAPRRDRAVTVTVRPSAGKGVRHIGATLRAKSGLSVSASQLMCDVCRCSVGRSRARRALHTLSARGSPAARPLRMGGRCVAAPCALRRLSLPCGRLLFVFLFMPLGPRGPCCPGRP